ncbi:large subunit ribosomal protein L32 [Mycoplasmoides fastidiosum]|uniref:Large ribosomal subunit protein bL32 n=1 Tax=Mycoplasmoides fastidiosum TaxID=92758 RepID=A0ABU0LYS1_9BACT|nr:50S ribosomal protein L32 [Mycoplasmoides fastidiosum]MDQ0513748.1 large subunit ribosomal protein L32 [Mycoplasmoides fastidiosum]UUD37830.1 50S ribosomal protein L32 [Mycoplasmoides fastidiosum]
MAVQQRRVSKTRRDKRRSHMALKNPTLVACSNCSKIIKPHRVCVECGYYKNMNVLNK